MPLTDEDFPYEVQVAFFIYSFLNDIWDGATGTYMGKQWGPVDTFFEVYEVDDKGEILKFMKMIERYSIEHQNAVTAQKRKAAERKAGSKNYAWNVQG